MEVSVFGLMFGFWFVLVGFVGWLVVVWSLMVWLWFGSGFLVMVMVWLLGLRFVRFGYGLVSDLILVDLIV